MWDNFERAYQDVKGTSTKGSCLDKVRGMLRTYNGGSYESALRTIQDVKTELAEVKGAWRLIGDNPSVKYAKPIAALEHELERERMRVLSDGRRGRETTGGTSAVVPLSATESAAAQANRGRNRERQNAIYTKMLSEKQTDREYRARIEPEFKKLLLEPGFTKFYRDETGWTNARAWGTWILRAITPEMVAGPGARNATEILRSMALGASVSGKQYAERYLLELSIYCAAAADRTDVSFIMGQAGTLLGAVAGPAISAVKGIAGTALSGAKTALTIAANKGAQAAAVDDTSKVSFMFTEEDGKPTCLEEDLMRFTHAWLRYVTAENGSRTASASVVRNEFGGTAGCHYLYEHIMDM
jgi:hypothetical protein